VLSLERSQYAQSAAYYRRSIAATDPTSMAEGNIFLANAGLASALKYLGDFDGAAAAFEHGTQIAARTFGTASRHYWAIASDWAEFRYARGDRQALAEFERLLSSLPADRANFRNASDALEAGQVMRKYGRCLTADGQAIQAVQELERARSLIEKSAPHLADIPMLQLNLANAYAAAGRSGDARSAFLSALTAYNAQAARAPQLGHALERWGRYLLTAKDTKGATMAFEDAIRLAAGRPTDSAVYARAGLAVVAASRNDVPAALRESEVAMIALEHIEGYYDVRLAPYVWGIRAEALLLAGRYDAGLELAQRRRDAALQYFQPGSRPVSQAEAQLSEASSRAQNRGTSPDPSRREAHVEVLAELFTTT
jgi:tetratricopeptide (TPR) repeat protein